MEDIEEINFQLPEDLKAIGGCAQPDLLSLTWKRKQTLEPTLGAQCKQRMTWHVIRALWKKLSSLDIQKQNWLIMTYHFLQKHHHKTNTLGSLYPNCSDTATPLEWFAIRTNFFRTIWSQGLGIRTVRIPRPPKNWNVVKNSKMTFSQLLS